MSGSPRIAVVVPVHDGAAHLGAALESVLGGSVRPDEVVVVDDGSSDASRAIAEGFGEPVRVLAQARAGAAAARNTGVAATTAELIGFLDADDLWTDDSLAVRVAALDRDPFLDVVFGAMEAFHSPELAEEERRRTPLPLGVKAARVAGTMLCRRRALERVGSFEARFRAGELIAWISRAQDLGLHMGEVPACVLLRRVHEGNHTRRERESLADYLHVVKAALDRRRAAKGTP